MRCSWCCSSADHLAVERALCPFQIRFPGAEPLLDAPFDLRQRLREALGELALADCQLPPAVVRQAPFLVRVCRQRVGMRAGDRDPELLRLCRRLLLGGRADRASGGEDEILGAGGACVRAAQRQVHGDGDDEDGHERADEDPDHPGHAVMLEPESNEGGREDDRSGGEQAKRRLRRHRSGAVRRAARRSRRAARSRRARRSPAAG